MLVLHPYPLGSYHFCPCQPDFQLPAPASLYLEVFLLPAESSLPAYRRSQKCQEMNHLSGTALNQWLTRLGYPSDGITELHVLHYFLEFSRMIKFQLPTVVICFKTYPLFVFFSPLSHPLPTPLWVFPVITPPKNTYAEILISEFDSGTIHTKKFLLMPFPVWIVLPPKPESKRFHKHFPSAPLLLSCGIPSFFNPHMIYPLFLLTVNISQHLSYYPRLMEYQGVMLYPKFCD